MGSPQARRHILRPMPETLTGSANYFEDFDVGDKFRHARGTTVGEVENQLLTKLVMNTAQAHFNEDAMKDGPFGQAPGVRPRDRLDRHGAGDAGRGRERAGGAGPGQAALHRPGLPRRYALCLHRGAVEGGRGPRGRRHRALQALGPEPGQESRLRRRANGVDQAPEPLAQG